MPVLPQRYDAGPRCQTVTVLSGDHCELATHVFQSCGDLRRGRDPLKAETPSPGLLRRPDLGEAPMMPKQILEISIALNGGTQHLVVPRHIPQAHTH